MVFCSRKKGTTDPKPRGEIRDFLTRQVEIHVSGVLTHLSRRPEYFSTATSFGICGSEGAFGPGGAAGLFWDDGGERRGAAASLGASGG